MTHSRGRPVTKSTGRPFAFGTRPPSSQQESRQDGESTGGRSGEWTSRQDSLRWVPRDAAVQVTLDTRSAQLRDDIVLIAAAAGVKVHAPGEDGDALPAERNRVLILGADRCTQPLPTARELVLVGGQQDAPVLWHAAAGTASARVCLLPAGAGWLAEYLGQLWMRNSAGAVLGLLGAVGGCGVSTAACLLAAQSARQGLRTLLIDGVRFGGGIELLLGAGDIPGLRWPDLFNVEGTVSPQQLADALPVREGVSCLSWTVPEAGTRPMETGPVGPVLAAARRAFDVTVVDLGSAAPGPLESHCDSTLLLVPARYRAVQAARAVVACLARPPDGILVCGPLAPALDRSMVAEATNLPLAGYLPRLHRAVQAAETGETATLLKRPAVRRLMQALLLTRAGTYGQPDRQAVLPRNARHSLGMDA